MRYFSYMLALFMALFLGSAAANATVAVSIDLTHQRMNVTSSSGSYSWPVSTARAGYITPTGVFRPQAMYRMTYSKIYGNAPMPHAIFFSGGYAIHGTYATGALGSPASHGCIRLAPGNAAALFQMVKAEGAQITISGASRARRVVSPSYRSKGSTVAQAAHTKVVKYARGAQTKSTKYAHGTHGKGTKYAAAPTKKHHVAARSQSARASTPSPVQPIVGLSALGL